jgi:hypothetical protein
MGLIMRAENEIYDRIINPHENNNCDNKIHEIWPRTLNNCYEIRSSYSFYFEIPLSILIEIQSAFVQLKNTIYRSQTYLVCQEGCVFICINTNEERTTLELSTRIINLYGILVNEENIQTSKLNLLKGFTSLFIEYKVVIEGILLDKNFPYKASNNLGKKIQVEANFSDLLDGK